MKHIPMTIDQVDAFSAIYAGDRSKIVFDGENLIVPDEAQSEILALDLSSASIRKRRLTDYAAAKRYTVETGGITVNGISLDTSRESQNMIAGAHAYVVASGEASVKFKATSGWVTLTAAETTAAAMAVGAHVQACFAAESAVDDAIIAGDIIDEAGVDAAQWPG